MKMSEEPCRPSVFTIKLYPRRSFMLTIISAKNKCLDSYFTDVLACSLMYAKPVHDFIIYDVNYVGVQYLIAFFSVAIISKPSWALWTCQWLLTLTNFHPAVMWAWAPFSVSAWKIIKTVCFFWFFFFVGFHGCLIFAVHAFKLTRLSSVVVDFRLWCTLTECHSWKM